MSTFRTRKRNRKLLIGALVVPVLVLVGLYFYFTHQFNQHVESFARQLSAFGQLHWNGVQLHPAGEARINGIRFQPHDFDTEIRIESIAFRAPDILALLKSSGEFNNGRMPESLGLSILGLQFPLPDTRAAGLDTKFTSGLPFEAAGCANRQWFSLGDLSQMGYWNLVVDIDMNYEISGGGDTVNFRISNQTREISRITASSRVRLGSGSRDLDLLARAWAMAQVIRLEATYRNLGFREKMVDFCAEETEMSPSEYLDHHHARWTAAWASLSLRPDTELQRAYRAFLDRPEELDLSVEPVVRLAVASLGQLSGEEIMSQLNLFLNVNHGPETRIALEVTDRAVADRSGNNNASSDAAVAAERRARVSRWTDISVREASQHIGSPIIIRTSTGDRVRGHLENSDAQSLHIKIRGVGGYLVRPYPIDQIENVQVIK